MQMKGRKEIHPVVSIGFKKLRIQVKCRKKHVYKLLRSQIRLKMRGKNNFASCCGLNEVQAAQNTGEMQKKTHVCKLLRSQ